MATIPSEHDLKRWCLLANRAGRRVFGFRNSCIMTSHALVAFLHKQDVEAECIRAEVHVHAERRDGGYGCSLGWDGDGTRRPAAKPGCWHGHLAVTSSGYMLDPTLDQAATSNGLRPQPAVYAMPLLPDDRRRREGDPWAHIAAKTWVENGLLVRHEPYHRQVGWKSRPESRPIHWADVVAEMGRIDGGRR